MARRTGISALSGAASLFPLSVSYAEGFQSSTSVPARVLGWLETFGATLALIWLLAARPAGHVTVLAVAICVAGAYAVGISVLTWCRRPSLRTIEALVSLTIAGLISVASHFGGAAGSAIFSLFYVLAALYAFSFLAPRRALLQGGLIAASYGVVLLSGSDLPPVGQRITSWLFVVGISFCSGLLLLALSEGLRRSERRLRSGLEASPIGAALVDPEGRLLYANPALESLLGGDPVADRARLDGFLTSEGAELLRRALARPATGENTATQFETALAGPAASRVAVTVSQRGERQPAAALVQVHDLSVGDRAAATERHLAAIVQSSEDAIFTKDLTGTVLSWNAGAERLYGYPASEIVGRSITTIIPPERQEEAMWVISQILEGHQPPHFETVRVRRDGERVDVSISATAIRDASNQVTSVAVVARDITERLRMARALGESERRYRQTFERNPQPMWIYDTQTLRFLDVNQRAIDAYGYSRAEFLAMTIRDIRPTEELPRLQDALSRGAYAGVDTFRHLKKSGEVIDAEVLSNEFDFAGRPARLVVAIDVTSRLRAEQLLRRHADHDALTGLFNRRRLQREIDAMLTRGGARDSCALIVLDIDHFKLVNDSFGHTRGDELVRRITEVLTGALDEGQVLGRLGGDEFAIAVPNVTEAQACEVTQKLLKHVKNNVVEGQHHVTASAGIAVVRGGRDLSSPAHQVSAEDLLVAADIALYQAKDAGRDRFALAGGIKRGHTWIDEVRAALHDDRLVLYAQPIIDLRTGSTVREELLIRMLSPDGDIIPPASFIPAAERFGLINEIDRWVVAQALELARGGRPLQINISARSFGDAAITRAVSEAVSRGVDPSSVVFEITETAAASNYREASDFAERLARAGCGLALDDFGTGFGTLSYLKHIPFNYLKIDMDFVRQLTREPVSQRIVKVIVRTARELGQKTIAEGVEHPATLPILQGLGVDMAQGYHIGPPIPIERTAAQAA